MATIQMLSAALLMLLLVMGHTHIGPLDSDTDSASAAQLTGEGAHHPQGRSAAEERYKWHQCLEKQCKEDLTCSECGPDDEGCAAMCRMNCWCGCGGHPRGGMDHDVWKACIQARNCRGDFEVEVCTDSCRENEDCMVRCELDHPNLCHCGCMLTATQRKHNWDTCIVQSQCTNATCSECGPDDEGCAAMCRMNCWCGCGGQPRGGMDHDAWEACIQARNCRRDFEVCRESCRENEDCMVRCELDLNQCYCGCMLATIQRKHNWDTCIVRSQCTNATCGECGPGDKGCAAMCRMNCECGCRGQPRGGMDHDMWEECNQERKCWNNFEECRDSCEGEHECVARCELVHNKCYCECVQMALTTTQRKHKWDTCIVQSRCHNKTCSECSGSDVLCAKRCARRCQCQCADYPLRDLSGEWEECFVGTQTCEEAHSACVKVCCDRDECRHGCDLALIECRCVCRSATEEEWLLWIKCKEEDEECGDNTCSECGEGDTDCAARCRHNCECRRCLGIPADSLDDLSVHECKKSGCLSEHKKCKEKCKAPQDKECEHSCQLAKEKCHCKCAQTSSETESRESEREEIIQHCNFIC